MCLNLIPIGSSTAFNAILSLTIIVLYFSYVVPIAFMAINPARDQHIPFGLFRLS